MAGSQLRLMISRNQSGSPSTKGNADRHGADASKETEPTSNWKSQYRLSSLKQCVGVVSKGAAGHVVSNSPSRVSLSRRAGASSGKRHSTVGSTHEFGS